MSAKASAAYIQSSDGANLWGLGRPSTVSAATTAAVWLLVSISAVNTSLRMTAPELVATRWFAALAWFATGMTVWRSRPATAFGPVMVLIGFLLFNRELAAGGSDWIALFAFLTQKYFWIPLTWVVLAYPTGHV